MANKKWKVELFDEFSVKCKFFYHDENSPCGFNCKHKDVAEVEDGTDIGRCFTFSCPLVPTADEEDFLPQSRILNEFEEDDFQEDTFVLVPVIKSKA